MKFDSEFERAQAQDMAALGIVRCSDLLPMTFRDATGLPFHRCADWRLKRRRWSCYIETKATLNNQPDKATADIEAANRYPGTSDQWHVAQTSWSNSIHNNAIVHHDFGPSNIIMHLPDSIFKPVTRGPRKGKLPEATVTAVNLLKKAGMWWLKTSDLQGYMRARDVAEAWHAQHTPAREPDEPTQTIHIWCRTARQLDFNIEQLKTDGYRLKRGTKTETSATVYLPQRPSL